MQLNGNRNTPTETCFGCPIWPDLAYLNKENETRMMIHHFPRIIDQLLESLVCDNVEN